MNNCGEGLGTILVSYYHLRAVLDALQNVAAVDGIGNIFVYVWDHLGPIVMLNEISSSSRDGITIRLNHALIMLFIDIFTLMRFSQHCGCKNIPKQSISDRFSKWHILGFLTNFLVKSKTEYFRRMIFSVV